MKDLVLNKKKSPGNPISWAFECRHTIALHKTAE